MRMTGTRVFSRDCPRGRAEAVAAAHAGRQFHRPDRAWSSRRDLAVSLIRNPSETDPLLTQSQRDDFPAELERGVIDGGAREGRPESAHGIGLYWALLLVLVFALIVGLALNWSRFFP